MKMRSKMMANFVILVAGVLLIVFHDRQVLSTIIVMMGIAFIIPSAVNLVLMLTRQKGKSSQTQRGMMERAMLAYGVVASLGGIGLGVWMVVSPETLIGIVVYLFAAMMIIAGLYNVIMLSLGHRPVRFPLWMYIMPVLTVAAGVVILCTDIKSIESTVVLMTGIAVTAFAVNRFFEHYRLSAAMAQEQAASATDEVAVKEETDDAHKSQ